MIKRIFFWLLFLIAIAALSIALFIPTARIYLEKSGKYLTRNEKQGEPYASYYNKRHWNQFWLWSGSSQIYVDHGEFRYEHLTNEAGIREKSVKDTDTNKFTILFLGDSFCEGVGAPYDSSMPRHLENYLLPDFPQVEVINAGVSGSDPFFAFRTLKDHFSQFYQPDLVIVNTHGTDLDDFIMRGGEERFQNGVSIFREGPEWEERYKKDHLFRYYIHEIKKMDFTFLNRERKAELIADYLCQLELLFLNMEEDGRKNGYELMVLFHPMPWEGKYYANDLTGFDSIQNPQLSILTTLEKSDFNLINVYDELSKTVNESNYKSLYWPIDGHYNGKGYQKVAEAAYKILKEKPTFIEAYERKTNNAPAYAQKEPSTHSHE